MPLTDLNLQECLDYRPELPDPPGLATFWEQSITEAWERSQPVSVERVDNGLRMVDTFDVTFSGAGGDPVRAWLHLPAARSEPLACVVESLGYGSGRGLAHERIFWAVAGYAHLVVDTRGQGWSSAAGDTPDGGAGLPGGPGLLVRGVASPSTYYYRRVFTDAVRAVATAAGLRDVDPTRVVAAGASQGGGISLALAGLVPLARGVVDDAPALAGVMADVPFLCHFRRAVDVAAEHPYREIADYLRLRPDRAEETWRTLSYFDAAVLVRQATAPALVSIAMMDRICPPSSCFAAYHSYAGPKELAVYELNDHEGGGATHRSRQLAWLDRYAGRPRSGQHPTTTS
jgi:cephalosporin-C deacetylase